MNGVSTLRAFNMYSGIQRNEFTLCVTAQQSLKFLQFSCLYFTK